MDIHYLSLTEAADLIRRRELSSEAVTQALLDRIALHDRAYNSVLLTLGETALAEARRADEEIAAGNWRGPLHGVPIGIKDLLWTRGQTTTGGMALFRDFLPEEDATVVERLRLAGAVVIAKLHTTEGATWEHHPSFPRPDNPWKADHWTGVSSSGSGVAAAAGFCFAAIGTDTGGSIRIPSSANNLTGIKPTWGRVSRHGLMHLSQSFDHIGPMARSARDAAAVLQAIAGPDPRDPTTLPDPVPDYLARMDEGVSGMTIGIDRAFASAGMPPEIVAALENALCVFERLGMNVREVTFPPNAEAAAGQLAVEMLVSHAATYPERAGLYGPGLRSLLDMAGQISAIDVAASNIERDRFRGRLRRLFAEVDFLLLPGLGGLVPRWAAIAEMMRGDGMQALFRYAVPFNIGGNPTISLPGGFTADGLPIGIQLAGPWLAEAELIRAGVAFQKETDFHMRHPSLETAGEPA